MKETRYGKLIPILLGAWLVFALTASALHGFQNDPNKPPIVLGLAASIPILIFLVWYRISAGFRAFVLSLNPRALVYVQSWRIAGFVFLVLYSVGLLPGFFALPAGWGDIAIGATAPLVAMQLTQPDRRAGFILWQVLGMADLISAVSMGAAARLISPQGIAPTIMASLPMSLIPTYAVPLFFILHIICIAQARGWRRAESSVSF